MPIVDRPRRLASIRTRRSRLPPPADRSDLRWEESWKHLFGQYAPAMTRYVNAVLAQALGRAPRPGEADDIVQDYLARCLEKGWLSREAERIRCFRAYLQTQLRRFTYDHLDYTDRKKRHAPGTVASDALNTVAGPGDDPAQDLDESWVEIAVAHALESLRGGNRTYALIIDDLLATEGETSPDLPERLGRTKREIAYLKHRARRRFAALLADELRATVRDDDAFAELVGRLAPFLP